MAGLHVEGVIGAVFARMNVFLEELRSTDESPLSPFSDKGGKHAAAARWGDPPANITVRNPDCCLPSADGRQLKAPQLYIELIRRLPLETRFFIDNSNSVPWTIHYFFHPRPESYHLSIEFASMGWGVGAAVGGAFGNRRAPSVCVAGDGCYLMSGQEITVAVEHSLPVIFVVMNDSAYGLIRHAHRLTGREQVGYGIPPVDFAMMARAAGAEAHTIRELKDLDRIDWRSLAERKGPTLLDVLIDPDEDPPLAMA
jgi:acetolactate synthase-1/2/3 large subunit